MKFLTISFDNTRFVWFLRQLKRYFIQFGISNAFLIYVPGCKKTDESPGIGLLLCKAKDSEVVKCALSRNLSPAVVAEYQTQLPDKKILQQKLHQLFDEVR